MKRLFLICCALFSIVYAQSTSLSLKDLESIFASGNFANADALLSKKDFYFQRAENIDDSPFKEKVFTWGLGNRSYSGKAEAWVYLTIENYGNGSINHLYMEVANIGDYANITSQLNAGGYKFIRTRTTNRDGYEQQESDYSSPTYILSACIYLDGESSSRAIELYKKGSVLDEYNGKKVLSFEDGTPHITYTVKDGCLISKYAYYIGTGEPFLLITPSDDKWNFEVYNLSGVLLFKGASPKKKIKIYEENIIDGFGTVKTYDGGKWIEKTGTVKLKVAPSVLYNGVRSLVVKTELIK